MKFIVVGHNWTFNQEHGLIKRRGATHIYNHAIPAQAALGRSRIDRRSDVDFGR
jgi:hypothetical protein